MSKIISPGKWAGTFSSIPWENGNMWIAIEADLGRGFEAMGIFSACLMHFMPEMLKNPVVTIDTSSVAITDTLLLAQQILQIANLQSMNIQQGIRLKKLEEAIGAKTVN